MDMKFENEIMKGFSSIFYFRCKMCGIVDQITSESPQELYMPINKALVNATLAIGRFLWSYYSSGDWMIIKFIFFLQLCNLHKIRYRIFSIN